MGIREQAEGMNAERDRREAEEQKRLSAVARERLPAALQDWSVGMGLPQAPDYRSVYSYIATLDYTFAAASFSFIEDGITFEGVIKIRLDPATLLPVDDSHALKIEVPRGGGFHVATVQDLARALAEVERTRYTVDW